MKNRVGHVSNSSSSSFIVGFDKRNLPQNADEMKKLLFGEDSEVYYDDYTISTKQAADTIWQDFCEQKGKFNIDDAIEDFSGGDGSPDYDDYTKDGSDDVDWELYELESNKYGSDKFDEMKLAHPNLDFYSFSYSDGDGNFGCVMEHGDIFDNLYNIRFSHH